MRYQALLAPVLFVLAALPQAAFAEEVPAEQFDAHTLARALFPPEQAATIVALKVNPAVFPTQPAPGVWLFSKPVAIRPGVCHRESYYVRLPLGSNVPESWAIRGDQLAVGTACDAVGIDDFAQVPQEVPPAEAAEALDWLQKAVAELPAALKRKGALVCVPGRADCEAKPRPAFAALPLANLFIIKKVGPDSWDFTLSTGRPGSMVWIVVASGLKSEAPKVTIDRVIPAPF
jgi:hypothetical protein